MILDIDGMSIFTNHTAKNFNLNDFKFTCINGLWGGKYVMGEVIVGDKSDDEPPDNRGYSKINLIDLEKLNEFIETYHDDWCKSQMRHYLLKNIQPYNVEFIYMIDKARDQILKKSQLSSTEYNQLCNLEQFSKEIIKRTQTV